MKRCRTLRLREEDDSKGVRLHILEEIVNNLPVVSEVGGVREVREVCETREVREAREVCEVRESV